MSLNSERCPYCFNKFTDLKYTDDPILTKDGSKFVYNESTGLLVPQPDPTQRLYKGFTIVTNKHITELQDIHDDNKPSGGWTPVEGEAGSFWIPNKIHIKELRDAIEKGLGITESTTPTERTTIMEQYLNYDEDGTERQNPHQMDWNDPTLTSTVWMGNISHMHIEDLRKTLPMNRFEQFYWGEGILSGYEGAVYLGRTNVEIPARESTPLHIHKWDFAVFSTKSGSVNDYWETYSWSRGGSIVRDISKIFFSAFETITKTFHHLGSPGSSIMAGSNDGIFELQISGGYNNSLLEDNKKLTPQSKIRLVYDSSAHVSTSSGGYREGYPRYYNDIVFRIRDNNSWNGYSYTTYAIAYTLGDYLNWFTNTVNTYQIPIASAGDIIRNLYNDLLLFVPAIALEDAELVYVDMRNVNIVISLDLGIENTGTAQVSSTLNIDNILFSSNGNTSIPVGE